MGRPWIFTTMHTSSLTTLNQCAVVAHDAGAANQLIHWLRAGDIAAKGFRFSWHGPALDLASAAGLAVNNVSVSEALSGADILIAGTGWATDIEKQAMNAAICAGIPTCAVFDHWVNYSERLNFAGKQLPVRKILVADEYALNIAIKGFPDILIQQLPDRYLRAQVGNIDPLPAVARHVLFLMEPVRTSWPGTDRSGELLAFNYFYERRFLLESDMNCPILIRPHPSDAAGKYQPSLAMYPHMEIDNSVSLASQISAARVVVGLQSYAMVVALAAGRRVISALPPQAPPAVLPQQGIEYLRDRL